MAVSARGTRHRSPARDPPPRARPSHHAIQVQGRRGARTAARCSAGSRCGGGGKKLNVPRVNGDGDRQPVHGSQAPGRRGVAGAPPRPQTHRRFGLHHGQPESLTWFDGAETGRTDFPGPGRHPVKRTSSELMVGALALYRSGNCDRREPQLRLASRSTATAVRRTQDESRFTG
jgi:hypothetical protein